MLYCQFCYHASFFWREMAIWRLMSEPSLCKWSFYTLAITELQWPLCRIFRVLRGRGVLFLYNARSHKNANMDLLQAAELNDCCSEIIRHTLTHGTHTLTRYTHTHTHTHCGKNAELLMLPLVVHTVTTGLLRIYVMIKHNYKWCKLLLDPIPLAYLRQFLLRPYQLIKTEHSTLAQSRVDMGVSNHCHMCYRTNQPQGRQSFSLTT